MNYIKQLKLDNAALRAEMESLRASINDILAYAGSSKFNYPNDSMNPKDIVLRCHEAISAGDSASNQVYADQRTGAIEPRLVSNIWNDIKGKAHMYKTAKYQGQYVSIAYNDSFPAMFKVSRLGSGERFPNLVPCDDLTDYCL